MSSGGKKNSAISDRLKAFDKKKADSTSTSSHPPTAPPSKKLTTPKRGSKAKYSPSTSPTSTDIKMASPSAQRRYFQQQTADSFGHMSVPEIVDRFNEQIEINAAAIAQEAAEKEARKERYQASKRKNRKAAKKRLEEKKQKKKQSKMGHANTNSNHYSLLPKTNAQSPTGVMLNAATSFLVDPSTYKAPTHLPQPTEPQKKLLLQAIADNVLFEDTTQVEKKATAAPELKDALVKAFESVTIKKGQTVEEAMSMASSSHSTDTSTQNNNALYVLEKG